MESGAQCDTRRELLLKCGLPDTRAPVLIPHFAGKLEPGPLPTLHDDSPSQLTFLPPVVWGPSLEQGSAEMLGLESGELRRPCGCRTPARGLQGRSKMGPAAGGRRSGRGDLQG